MADVRGTPHSQGRAMYDEQGIRVNRAFSPGGGYGREDGSMMKEGGWDREDPHGEVQDCCRGWPGVVRTRQTFGVITTLVGAGLIIWAVAHGCDQKIESGTHFLANWNVVTMIIMGIFQFLSTPSLMYGAVYRQPCIVGVSTFFLIITSIYIFLLVLFLFVPSWQAAIADLDGSSTNPCCNTPTDGRGCPVPAWGEYSAVASRVISSGDLGNKILSRSSNYCQVVIFFLDFGVYDENFLPVKSTSPTIASPFAVSASGKPLFAPYTLLVALAIQLIYLFFTLVTYLFWESPSARRRRAGLPPISPSPPHLRSAAYGTSPYAASPSRLQYAASPSRLQYAASPSQPPHAQNTQGDRYSQTPSQPLLRDQPASDYAQADDRAARAIFPPPQASPARGGEGLCGVGVVLTTDADGSLKVASLVPGGPAERSGRVLQGDEIAAIDAHPVAGAALSQLAAALLGPEGSVVLMGVRRPGALKVQNVALIRGGVASPGTTRGFWAEREQVMTLTSSVGYREGNSPPGRWAGQHLDGMENPRPAAQAPPTSFLSPAKIEIRPASATVDSLPPPPAVAVASFASPPPGSGASRGLGLDFSHEGGSHVVSRMLPGGAAAASRRVDVGDAIVEVDGVSVEGMSTTFVSALLNGPPNSTVALTLHKEGPGGRATHVTLRRGG